MATRFPDPLTRMPTARNSVVFSINTRQLDEIAENMKAAKIAMNFHLEARLTHAANIYADELAKAAPSGKGNDPRHPVKLKESFRVVKLPGAHSRQVITLAPRKFSWTNYGTRPPTLGSGYIFPRKKGALYWEGLQHPVLFVSEHPGTKGTHWADAIISKYLPGAVTIENSAHYIASTEADWFVETFTNLNNRNKPKTAGRLSGAMASFTGSTAYGAEPEMAVP